jgi:hypothetical protein
MTETFPLTQENVTSALREIAAENPSFNYQETDRYQSEGGCIYVDPATKAPSCLVGQVVYRVHGESALALLLEFDQSAEDTTVGSGEWPAEIPIADDITDRILATAQLKQDVGETWFECVEQALAAA